MYCLTMRIESSRRTRKHERSLASERTKAMRNWLLQGTVIVCIAAITGCQSWSNAGLYNPTRVPPPPTGAFQTPSGYYNNTSPAPSQAKTPAASTNASTFRPVTSGGKPSSEIASFPNTMNSNSVAQASFVSPSRLDGPARPARVQGVVTGEYTAPEMSSPQFRPATASLSDEGASENP